MNDTNDEELDGADVRKPFYVICPVHLDGSADISSEGLNHYADMSDAVGDAKDQTEQHGVAMLVIECHAVRKVTRGPVRVSALKVRR